MGRHLKMENWFRKTTTGTWQRLRVSAVAEQFFPMVERVVLQKEGPSKAVLLYKQTNGWSLEKAWACLKTKVNTPPGKVTQPFLE